MYFGSMNGHGSALNSKETKLHSGFVANWFTYWLMGRETLTMKANKYVYAASTFTNGKRTIFSDKPNDLKTSLIPAGFPCSNIKSIQSARR